MSQVWEVLEAGECTAECLCASVIDADKCECRCNGYWHGAAARARIESGEAIPTWVQIVTQSGDGPIATNYYTQIPVVGQSISDFNHEYRRQKTAKDPYFLAISRRGRGFTAHFDAWWKPVWCDHEWNPRDPFIAWKEFTIELMQSGNVHRSALSPEYVQATEFRTALEARTYAALLEEAAIGNVGAAFIRRELIPQLGRVAA